MKTEAKASCLFNPALEPADATARHWLTQVSLRLRRQICWIWHERGVGTDAPGIPTPAPGDRLNDALDAPRYQRYKHAFFASDPAAAYLSELIVSQPEARPSDAPLRGSFGWARRTLALDDPACFVLALALAPQYDSTIGAVIAACMNDATRTRPCLALAQKLWDEPADLLPLADDQHDVYRHGLVTFERLPGWTGSNWEVPLGVPAPLATQLWGMKTRPAALVDVEPAAGDLPEGATRIARQLRGTDVRDRRLGTIELRGPADADLAAVAAGISASLDRRLLAIRPGLGTVSLEALASYCWLSDTDLFVPAGAPVERSRVDTVAARLPITVFIARTDAEAAATTRGPLVRVEATDYDGRLQAWTECFAPLREGEAAVLSECARRFRYEPARIRSIAAAFGSKDRPLDVSAVTAACRAELRLELGELAEQVAPRFERSDLVLPKPSAGLIDEITHAMRSLADVHYGWGTARPWSEAGIAVLFAGPPGTGKTMAAEVLAAELGLPMYRVDVSQVVSKYVGETEKNLRRIFDAAEAGDILLFFDEAESLFGRRMTAKSAQDRWANLEVSYLLSRMERAKGLTVLATNRRDDFDTAFARRLRYIVEFPAPDAEARTQIWRRCLPPNVDASGLDLSFLARAFSLTGGQIRSAVFNACLQSAGRCSPPTLSMERVVIAIKREYDKLGHAISAGQFGPYAALISDPQGATR